jgi:RNA polymerase sigma factor (sigma-70 family)
MALDEVLEELGRLNERHGRVVELRFFGGLSVEETAHVLDVSPQTVRSDWRMARAWLRQRLER